MTPEAKTKKMVTAILKDAEAWYFCPYGGGMGRAGIPDFVCCVKGYFLAIECKGVVGKTTALQDRELAAIYAAGGSCIVVHDNTEDYRQLQSMLFTLQLKDTS